jgi:glycosyltransferase involved in cell wall biosynthesis
MEKKILIINDNLPNQINGVVTTYKNLEPFAIRDGYTIDYIHPGRYRYIDCPKYNEVKLAYPKGLGKEIEEINPTYIHIATEGPLGLFARRYLTVRGHRYNTAYHTKFPEGLKSILGIPEYITWPIIRWFHKNSNRVLVPTESMASTLREQGFGNNLVPWTRGVDRKLFKPVKRSSDTELTLLCVSRVSAEKNLEDFFNLDFPSATKIMVGDGPKLEEYKEKYTGVEFVGFKTGKDLAKYFQKADVFVFPSRWDTFGLVMVEAMSCGTPVAAYPVQGPLDVIEEGRTGCMRYDLNEAVQDALTLDRKEVYQGSKRWSWEKAWEIFRDNLVTKM